MQAALVHQVGTHLDADAVLEQDVIGHDEGRPAARLQAAVDVLQETELLVAGGEGEVVARV